jgi:hypothetical protein
MNMKERKRSANMTDEEYMEWGGLVFGPCHLCTYCGDGKELNDLGWCYQHERLVKPLWGCCEFEKPEGEE